MRIEELASVNYGHHNLLADFMQIDDLNRPVIEIFLWKIYMYQIYIEITKKSDT